MCVTIIQQQKNPHAGLVYLLTVLWKMGSFREREKRRKRKHRLSTPLILIKLTVDWQTLQNSGTWGDKRDYTIGTGTNG